MRSLKTSLHRWLQRRSSPRPGPVGKPVSLYVPRGLDFSTSPVTGWSRDTWIEAGIWILGEALRALPDPHGPMLWPRQSDLLYPSPADPPHRHRAAAFEGLARTLLIAAPVLCSRDADIDGISLRDWFRQRVIAAVDPDGDAYAGPGSELDPRESVQQQVEGAALAVALWMGREWLWEPMSPAQRQQVLDLLLDLGMRNTLGHNWRFFNVLMLSFVDQHGGRIDTSVLLTHLRNILAWQTGDGYYRDGERFDYYGAWSFQFYSALWINRYGAARLPDISAALQVGLNTFAGNYPALFARDGRHIVWGRSGIYRSATAAPLAALGLVMDDGVDWGYLRQLCSGNLRSLLENAATWQHGIPAPGLYGVFEPLLQRYSCSASAYWFGKIFLACDLAADHPFWTATETQGPWAAEAMRTQWWAGPGLASIARSDGSSELVPTKVRAHPSRKAGADAGYLRLAYHSDFPWAEAVLGTVPMGIAVCFTGDRWEQPVERRLLGREGDWTLSQLHFGRPHSVLDVAMCPLEDGMLIAMRPRINGDYDLQVTGYALPLAEDIEAEPWADGTGQCLSQGPGRPFVAMRVPVARQRVGSHRLDESHHPAALQSRCLSVTFEQRGYHCSDYLVLEMRYSARAKQTLPAFIAAVVQGPLGLAGPLELQTCDGECWRLDFRGAEGALSS